MDRETKLLPCPLCGLMPVLAQIKAGIEWWQVECEADRGDGCGLAISRSAPSAAIAAWNRRPTQPPLDLRVAVEALDALKSIQMLKRTIMIDVGSCHSNRGQGASAEMRSDDRDMRSDMETAFAQIDNAIGTLTAQADSGRDAGDGEVG